MTIYGYIHHSSSDDTVAHMKRLGCQTIFNDSKHDTHCRPQRRQLFTLIEEGDTLVVPRLAHIVGNTMQASLLIDYCSLRSIRLISVEEEIDTRDELFGPLTQENIVRAVCRLPHDVATLRRSHGARRKIAPDAPPTLTREERDRRDEKALNMYLAGFSISDILKHNRIGRATLYRMLERHNVPRQIRPGRWEE